MGAFKLQKDTLVTELLIIELMRQNYSLARPFITFYLQNW